MYKKKKALVFYILSLLLFLLNAACSSNSPKIEDGVEQLFDQDDLLYLKLYADYSLLFSDTSENRTYHKGRLEHKDQIFEVDIKMRGNSRRDPEICPFPPIKIRFDSITLEKTIFDGQYKLKLVSHCNSDSSSYEQLVIGEYLIYRIFNLLTDKSFKVRPLIIEYLNLKNASPVIERFGFLIESKKEFARRNQGKFIKNPEKTDTLEPIYLSRIALFQFMISNTDWSARYGHNIKYFEKNQKIYPIPYDFDYSGMLNAPYAVPDTELGVDSLQEHKFRGFCRSFEEYLLLAAEIEAQKASIYSLLNSFSRLSDQKKKQYSSHINEFFNIINNRKLFRRHLEENCRDPIEPFAPSNTKRVFEL